MRHSTARFKHGKKSRIGENAPSTKALAWLVKGLAQGADLTKAVELRHEGRCGRCGRKLTTPASIDTGIGPVCAAALGIDWAVAESAEQAFDALRYMLAGRAFLTTTSRKTGVSFTYMVEQADPREGDTHRLFFAKVLTGPDNTNSRCYSYLGTIWVGGAEPFKDPELEQQLEDARRAPSKTYQGRQTELRWAREAIKAEAAQAQPMVGTLAYTARAMAASGLMTGDEADAWKDQRKAERMEEAELARRQAAHACVDSDKCWCNNGEYFVS